MGTRSWSTSSLKIGTFEKDKCGECTTYNNTPDVLKTEEITRTYNDHLNEKNLCFQVKENLKKNCEEGSVVVAFDFQKTLLSPFGQTRTFYYSRRLKNFNFTITNIKTMVTDCYFWHEGNGNKGSCEVATCLLLYLKKLAEMGIKKTVTLFCDRCSRQNNKFVVIMLSIAMELFKFEELGVNYLVSGHSHTENDNAHITIEDNVRNEHVYTTDDWALKILNAFKKKEVNMMRPTYGDFFDFKKIPQFAGFLRGRLTYKDSATSTTFVKWTKIMQLKFLKGDPTTMYFKYSYGSDKFEKVDLIKDQALTTSSGRTNVVESIKSIDELPKCYKAPPGVNKNKLKDLKTLCEKNHILPCYHHFYESLPSGRAVEPDIDQEYA